MARINIEECWWSDPRRMALVLNIGYEADSAAVNMWRLAQEFWAKGKSLIPKLVFDKIRHASALIDAGLADVRAGSVYVRGSSEYLTWLEEKREQARAAGKKSAESRRKKSGSAQPKGGRGHQITEREPNENRTKVNGTEPSGSGSGSKENIYMAAGDLEKAISLADQTFFQAKYPDSAWVKDQIELCHRFHMADETQTPRTKGQWMRKLQTWLENNWPKRPQKLRAVPVTGGWAHIDGVD